MFSDLRLIHRVVPFVHEDLMGFLTRVAERNHLTGSDAILWKVTSSRQMRLTVGHVPILAEFCRGRIEEILQLSGIETRQSDGSRVWQINGQWLSKAYFVASLHTKVCPACLHEAPYVRGIWSLPLDSFCCNGGMELRIGFGFT